MVKALFRELGNAILHNATGPLLQHSGEGNVMGEDRVLKYRGEVLPVVDYSPLYYLRDNLTQICK